MSAVGGGWDRCTAALAARRKAAAAREERRSAQEAAKWRYEITYKLRRFDAFEVLQNK